MDAFDMQLGFQYYHVIVNHFLILQRKHHETL